MKRKITAIILAVSMLLTLVACGSTEKSGTTDEETQQTSVGAEHQPPEKPDGNPPGDGMGAPPDGGSGGFGGAGSTELTYTAAT